MSHWQPVAHRRELAARGDYVLLPWKDDGEIAVTNIDGELVAFDNRCGHRGARIFSEPRGNREPRCPYHGRLATAANVARLQVKDFGGFLFARDRAPSVEPRWPLQIFDFLSGIPALTLKLHSSLRFVMDCHWTVAVENALDFEHVAHVHPESLSKLALVPKQLHCSGDGSSIEEFTSHAKRLGQLGHFFPYTPPFDYIHAHFFPYSCLSSTRGFTYSLQHYFPRPDGKTSFIHRLYTAPTTRPMPGFFDAVARLNEQVFREDADVCANVAAGHNGKLGAHEKRIAHFRSWL